MNHIKIFFIVSYSIIFCFNAYAKELDPGTVEDKLVYFVYHNYETNITSMPLGARVYIDDEFVGETPVTYYIDGKVSKFTNFVIEAKPQVDSSFHFPQTFTINRFSTIPRHIHFDMLHIER